MARFDPSIPGTFIFGLIAGICPCKSVLFPGLSGYLTSGNTEMAPARILTLTVSFGIGTMLVLLNSSIAWAIGGCRKRQGGQVP